MTKAKKRVISKEIKRQKLFIKVYTPVLLIATFFVLLNTFLIPKKMAKVTVASGMNLPSETTQKITKSGTTTEKPVSTAMSYKDKNLSIQITKERDDGSEVYLADVKVSDPRLVKTALAQASYGQNITDTMSNMAKATSAIFAINGDYYGFRSTGYVIRNKVLYRSTPQPAVAALVMDKAGNLTDATQTATGAQTLVNQGAYQSWSFGPTLVKNSQIQVGPTTEVLYGADSSNPRSAIGQIEKNHYLFVVSDGRTAESKGLSLEQLAQIFIKHKATFAYNLDGGGSSEMILNGKIINKDIQVIVTGKERSVSDMIYVGYKLQGEK